MTGATGFIASQLVTDLISAGHKVTCCVRNIAYAQQLFPSATIISCDFIKDNAPHLWVERLTHIDVVINCVGILYHPNPKLVWAVHYDTPKALFDACHYVGIKKIIQISALGIEQAKVPYATSKKAADDYLLGLGVPAIILRPSLVYGRGSYGGTSLFRGLAGLPFITPVPGKGDQQFQPIHIEDLSKAIISLLQQPIEKSVVLNAVSGERVNLTAILSITRAWLGFSKTRLLSVPLGCIQLGALLGNCIPYSVLNSNSYQLLMQNNVTTTEETEKFHHTIGFVPQKFSQGIYRQPSSVQDRLHARLYFLKPVLKWSIAFIWLFTAICCLWLYPRTASYDLLAQVGVSSFWQPVLFYSACIVDAGIGLAVLFNIQYRKTALLQIVLIIIYSAILTWKIPCLWFEPFAPLAKNIPLLAAILVSLAMESER